MERGERRLKRALGRIVIAALAAPLGGAVACHAAADDARGDASTDDANARVDDAALDSPPDATAPLTDASTDARACAPFSIDGAAFEGPSDGCADFRLLPCGIPPDAKVEDCLLDLTTCAAACGTSLIYYCQLTT